MCVDLECDVELLMPFFCLLHAYFSLFLVTVIVHLLVCHGTFGVTEQLCSHSQLIQLSFFPYHLLGRVSLCLGCTIFSHSRNVVRGKGQMNV